MVHFIGIYFISLRENSHTYIYSFISKKKNFLISLDTKRFNAFVAFYLIKHLNSFVESSRSSRYICSLFFFTDIKQAHSLNASFTMHVRLQRPSLSQNRNRHAEWITLSSNIFEHLIQALQTDERTNLHFHYPWQRGQRAVHITTTGINCTLVIKIPPSSYITLHCVLKQT